ncbi:MAG: hypothetical protein A3B99_00660 [Candidatus Yanofskybacteria bacterium RIFCSPHIGHO2_02_FULL_44_12b]|uniref:GtrA/DPMS transmembrane domain-containing protein n=2 Tax=Candidatus Yanofskyibacteriota TaxID=1752733 RepID=A0A1F8GJJ9_9BACT|nr:MAG: GtrA family protein [Candidatus Yanofskybacteria bacterium GW2011_GWA2_44_9]OGN05121.1 MAG: hypothetical protein A2659_02170 [Candidatus Yanofskybacteria bacterium RIFCSPHIGHO2_01_FULL_44_24]OGN15990.1 MAG: hypothetical protein A3B99_00660 [Candidatus Yanofskybacteria bacterium RIFCSPHIGHO2_02_FULL_44_12b]OGN25501.1 MAG: hypothetical protein A2925_02105 [Candidatus Yanofskybacteria bacterium RIFCSPLOWO2_01_FULL_44_22]
MPTVFRFLVAGGAGTLVYYGVLYCLTEFLGIWYIASAIIAWTLNWGINFTLQKRYTFRDKSTGTVNRQLRQYFAMAIGFLVLNTTLLYAMVEYLGMDYLIAQLILSAIFSILSFFISRYIFSNTAPSA